MNAPESEKKSISPSGLILIPPPNYIKPAQIMSQKWHDSMLKRQMKRKPEAPPPPPPPPPKKLELAKLPVYTLRGDDMKKPG